MARQSNLTFTEYTKSKGIKISRGISPLSEQHICPELGASILYSAPSKNQSYNTFYGSDGTITVEEEHFSHILVHAAVIRSREYHSTVFVQLHRLICSQFYHSAEQDSSIALSAFFTLLEFLDRLVKFCNQICFNGFLKERYNQREYREVVRNR